MGICWWASEVSGTMQRESPPFIRLQRQVLLGAEHAHSCLLLLWTTWQPVCTLGPKICSLDSFQIALIVHNALSRSRSDRAPAMVWLWGTAMSTWAAAPVRPRLICSSLTSFVCIHVLKGVLQLGWGHSSWGKQMRVRYCWTKPGLSGALCSLWSWEQTSACLAVPNQVSWTMDMRFWPQPSAVALDTATVT